MESQNPNQNRSSSSSVDLAARFTCAVVEEQLCDGVSGIVSSYSMDGRSEHNNVISNDTMKAAASPNSSDHGTSTGSLMVDDDMDHHRFIRKNMTENQWSLLVRKVHWWLMVFQKERSSTVIFALNSRRAI
ncbi:hypothetical protein U1Q18_046142 [Sarracenia purpurea var. burkii]